MSINIANTACSLTGALTVLYIGVYYNLEALQTNSLGGGLVGIFPSTNFGASNAVFSSGVKSLSCVYSPVFCTPPVWVILFG